MVHVFNKSAQLNFYNLKEGSITANTDRFPQVFVRHLTTL